MLFVRIAFGCCIALSMMGPALAEQPSVPNEKPLTEMEIKALVDGRTFDFVAYDEPLTGKTSWDLRRGLVWGSYVAGGKAGTFEIDTYIENDKLCTKSKKRDAVCQIVYRYEDGFMEVTPKGVVHAVSKPVD